MLIAEVKESDVLNQLSNVPRKEIGEGQYSITVLNLTSIWN
jgi:hypothetical protein